MLDALSSQRPPGTETRHSPRWLPWVLAGTTAALGLYTVRSILVQTGGEPCLPLDDGFIHLQYARSLAELRPFEYVSGAPASGGTTSLLWPLLLAPAVALAPTALGAVYFAWALGFVALFLLARETHALARGLVPEPMAVGAGALTLCFGGHAWFAASGMEVVLFGWLLTAMARTAARLLDRVADDAASPGRLIALGLAAPLCRPEGAAATLLIALALGLWGPPRSRALALPLALSPLLPAALFALATGDAIATTATAKWMPLNPYYRDTFDDAVAHNIVTLFTTLLDGRIWARLFIPEGALTLAIASLVAPLALGLVHRRPWHAAAVVTLALGMLIPTTYETFLVNRLRYLWPFTSGWLVGTAALCELVALSTQRLRLAVLGPLALAAIGLTLASLLPSSVDDVARSADAIARQQVSMARWARHTLPPSAIIGVNDTGAMAYLSERRTFDMVGLTTAGQAPHWNAGSGSRFERLERLEPEQRPTHFIVYPEWLDLDVVLGQFLTERTVRASILGGATMAAFNADYATLRSAEAPLLAAEGVIDRLDVADLASEAAHAYQLLDGTRSGNVVVQSGERADGGRAGRVVDVFNLIVAPGGAIVMRLGTTEPTVVTLSVEEQRTEHSLDPALAWQELIAHRPDGGGAREVRVRVEAGVGRFTSLHYFSLGPHDPQ